MREQSIPIPPGQCAIIWCEGDAYTNLFNFHFHSIKRESFHCQINIVEGFMCIYLRHKTNISAIASSQSLREPLFIVSFYCLRNENFHDTWKRVSPGPATGVNFHPRFSVFPVKLIALLGQFSIYFTIDNARELFALSGGKFEPILIDNAYKVVMRLNIKSVSQSDFGSYRCVAKNSLGDTDGTIKLYSELLHYLLQTVLISFCCNFVYFIEIPRGEMNHLDFHEGRKKNKGKWAWS